MNTLNDATFYLNDKLNLLGSDITYTYDQLNDEVQEIATFISDIPELFITRKGLENLQTIGITAGEHAPSVMGEYKTALIAIILNALELIESMPN